MCVEKLYFFFLFLINYLIIYIYIYIYNNNLIEVFCFPIVDYIIYKYFANIIYRTSYLRNVITS